MAFETRLRYDGVETYLEAQLDAGSNVISFNGPLIMDGNVPIPDIVGDSGEYLVLTILDSNYILEEIVYLYEYTSTATTGYVERGQEGTSPSITHPVGSKVVHAATALDFISVQDHDSDPNAHYDEMLAIAQAEAASAVTAHEEATDPHPQYAQKSNPVLQDPTIPSGSTLIIQEGGTLHVQEGATILVDGTLEISSIGKLIINGHEIRVDNNEPADLTGNMVWIQTFGA